MDPEITLQANLQETTADLLELVRPSQKLSSSSTLMLGAVLCALITIAVLTLPGLVFNQATDDAYTQFSRILASDRVSLLPLGPAGMCCAVALLLPFPRFSQPGLARS
jgi:hypothetical protein